MVDLVGRGRIGVRIAIGSAGGVGLASGAAAPPAAAARRGEARCARGPAPAWASKPPDADAATGASTFTGGRFDCCACAPLDTDATAIRPATAETVLPESLSKLFIEFAATERNDCGATTCPITNTPHILVRPLALATSDGVVVSAAK